MHNLDIHSYSLNDLFSLFDIPNKTNITIEHIKHAKKKVIMSHPDKSKLPSEYFLFYKKAFELIVAYYETQNKTSTKVPIVNSEDNEIKYEPIQKNENHQKEVAKHINKMSNKDFQSTFNRLFEENMREKIDPSKNAWFKEETPLFTEQVQSMTQMNSALERIKEKTQSMTIYRGITTLNSGSSGANLYLDDDTENAEYISSDPFSKLKYDDLRKVHKDQTVFSVSEKDMSKVKTYSSVDQYKMERSTGYVPIEKSKAQLILEQREKEMQENIMRKQHISDLKALENEKKNRQVMATFLRLQN